MPLLLTTQWIGIQFHTECFLGDYPEFNSRLSLDCGVGSHALLTRLLLIPFFCVRVQLACVRLNASVHSEPGSNSCLFFLLFFFLSTQKHGVAEIPTPCFQLDAENLFTTQC